MTATTDPATVINGVIPHLCVDDDYTAQPIANDGDPWWTRAVAANRRRAEQVQA